MGLYALISRSRRPEAKRFRIWLAGEALPAIRNAGTHPTPETAALDVSATPIVAKPEVSVSALVELLGRIRLVQDGEGAKP